MMKINKLEIENVKRVKAVKIEPSENGLTIIGGRNNQGKTSVLDSIAWALGGDRYRPSQAVREGSVIPPHLHIVMSNGLEVERKGKNSDLKVTDPTGKRAGQQLLNEFVEELAIELEVQENDLYNCRRAIGQIADQKAKFAKEMPYYPDAPKEPISASELIRAQQEILAKNGENHRKRMNVTLISEEHKRLTKKVEDLRAELATYSQQLAKTERDLECALKSAEDLHDESTAELEQNIRDIEVINEKVRTNLNKEKAEEDANAHRAEYDTMTAKLNDVRQKKIDLLKNASLPLPGLSVENGELTYNGHRWDSMSGSEQLKVSTAIVRKLNPNCGFVLIDKLAQMDTETLQDFGTWLEQEGLQAIATRVSTGGECSIIIEDGYVKGEVPQKKEWKAGEF